MGSNFFSNPKHNHRAVEPSTATTFSGNVTLFPPTRDPVTVLAELAAEANILADKTELKDAQSLMSNKPLLQVVPMSTQ